jgi:glycerol-3-phosphate dehydrogenase
MPITEQVELVCHENKPVKEAMVALMSRDTKPE